MVSGQINQIIFCQGVEPLQPLHGFHFSERVQGAVFRIAFVHRTGLGEGKQAGPEFVFSPLAGCFQSRGVHFGTRRLRFLKESASCVSGCQVNEPWRISEMPISTCRESLGEIQNGMSVKKLPVSNQRGEGDMRKWIQKSVLTRLPNFRY